MKFWEVLQQLICSRFLANEKNREQNCPPVCSRFFSFAKKREHNRWWVRRYLAAPRVNPSNLA